MEQILRSRHFRPHLLSSRGQIPSSRAYATKEREIALSLVQILELPTINALITPWGRILKLSQLGLFGGVFFLAEVRVQEGEPLENALRRFKRKVQTEDIIKEVKRHSFYLKPGEKKRVKEALARKRNRKKVRKEQD
jgi:small subunit ribosomal protein S21